MQPMHLPTIIRANVPTAITPAAGWVQSLTIQGLPIANPVTREMRQPTTILTSVRYAIAQPVGLVPTSGIATVIQIVFPATLKIDRRSMTRANAPIATIRIAGVMGVMAAGW